MFRDVISDGARVARVALQWLEKPAKEALNLAREGGKRVDQNLGKHGFGPVGGSGPATAVLPEKFPSMAKALDSVPGLLNTAMVQGVKTF
ncbi:unnamed protein product [Amoebophrya sp. A25]|nr:unnamed protein product [Amoebophrya sp. A25]|eukprot:GSA25T00017163001.1